MLIAAPATGKVQAAAPPGSSVARTETSATRIDVQEVIRRSVAANQTDFQASPQFSHKETDREDGNPAKTYEVEIIQGSPYHRLIAINGEPLPPAEQRQQAQKMEKAIQKRKRESAQERAERIAKWQKERKEQQLMLAEMAKAFDYTFLGDGTLNGHSVYMFSAEPKPTYEPPNQRAKVLTGMHGKLWIDEQDYHWVKVEAEVVKPVYFEGFLARVDPGTRFVLEKQPVANGVWEPTRFSVSVASRILGFIAHNSEEVDVFSDYQPRKETTQARTD